MDPTYATPTEMWRLALPPDTLFKDKSLESGGWSAPIKTGTGSGRVTVTVDSNPRDTFQAIVRCLTPGEVNVYGVVNPGNPPSFIFSLDNGATFSQPFFANEAQTIDFIRGGFSVSFQNGIAPSFNIGDSWAFTTNPSPDIVFALETASRMIDGYISDTYCLPLVEWGTDIKLACCELARWILVRKRGLDGEQDMQVYNPKATISWLTQIAKGELQARVKEQQSFVFPQLMIARKPYATDWRF